MWTCPACKEPLTKKEKVWVCNQGHLFDIAKEGYVNLLLANQKRTTDPGDNNTMINARRAFLEQDHYQPLAHKVADLIHAYTEDKPELSLYDIGCGEGYYINVIKNHLDFQNRLTSAYGSDISKNAIQKASKKHKDIPFAVASNANLPVASEDVDALLQIFAPSDEKEIKRVLKQSGIWCNVSPAAKHLSELKEGIYDIPKEHKTLNTEVDGFTLLHKETLTYQCQLPNSTDRKNLLMMTPFYWSTDQNEIEKLIKDLTFVTISFQIRLFASATE